MQTVKQIVHDVADHLPEQATWDDAMYVMYVRQKIDEGLRDIAEGRTYTQEEVEAYLLGGMPESANTEERIHRLYVLENIRRGQEDAHQGKTIATEQLLNEIKSW